MEIFISSSTDFWFKEMGEIRDDQFDFFTTILHEICHGLGFSSGFNHKKYAHIITPLPLFERRYKIIYKFRGFAETVFDKYLVANNDNTRITDIFSHISKKLKHKVFYAWDKPSKVLELCEKEIKIISNLLKKERSISFYTKKLKFMLETGNELLSSDYLCHLSSKIYKNRDMLMTMTITKEKTFEEDKIFGKYLINIFETSGYATFRNPNPNFKVCYRKVKFYN